ncbi:hypothetical protein BV898_16446 [Hypsibius exemplaris]|uniref:Uncharacterized protein n=1 Tax=Hypsibius exemplaris TaxID=2072580 RepID=A0A9X6NET4_HYPEX|nr:hypothetical protein BV898_16446 [Hypsibius exemplaris]
MAYLFYSCLLVTILLGSGMAQTTKRPVATLKQIAPGSFIAVNNWNCLVVDASKTPECSQTAPVPSQPGESALGIKKDRIMKVGSICCRITTERSG